MGPITNSTVRRLIVLGVVATCGLLFSSAQNAVNYTHNGDSLQGYIYYPDVGTIPEAEINNGYVPLVVIVP
jgi:hypothetical protein